MDAVLPSVRKCSKVILLYEDTRTGGMAGELAALIAAARRVFSVER